MSQMETDVAGKESQATFHAQFQKHRADLRPAHQDIKSPKNHVADALEEA